MGDFVHQQSEDCLTLTVWTPATDDAGRPVLFWIHGGGFLSGGGALDWYDATNLCCEGDIVVVSPNYRQGALGFLHWSGVSAGNLGLLDLELALSWVRENIASFGGDPDQITAMGQSGGAWSAALLAGRMEHDNPTIRKLILHSAPLGIPAESPANARTVADEFVRELRIDDRESDPASAARAADAAAVLSAQDAAIRKIGLSLTTPGYPPVPFGPVTDGVVLPSTQDYRRFLATAAGRAGVMVGWTRDEMNAFIPPQLQGPLPEVKARLVSEIFSTPSLQWAADAARQGQSAFAFCFDWAPPGNRIGACHCIDLPFVFGTAPAFASAAMLEGADPALVSQLSRRMRAAWLAFIRNGDPNAAGSNGLPAWPPFRPAERAVMHINVESTVSRESRAD